MGKLVVGLALVTALLLVFFGLLGRATQPGPEPLRLLSMAASGQAMQQSGSAMRTHGQAMLDQGRRAGDQELAGHGEHWLRDSQEVLQLGRWMAMDPTAPGNLVVPPAELVASGDWARLQRYSAAMQHDLRRVRGVDLEALRANGQAMRDEGRNMSEHGRVMAEDAEAMVARHGLTGQAASDLRQAAVTMRDAGGQLSQVGARMVEYVDQLKRSMGLR